MRGCHLVLFLQDSVTVCLFRTRWRWSGTYPGLKPLYANSLEIAKIIKAKWWSGSSAWNSCPVFCQWAIFGEKKFYFAAAKTIYIYPSGGGGSGLGGGFYLGHSQDLKADIATLCEAATIAILCEKFRSHRRKEIRGRREEVKRRGDIFQVPEL